MHLRKCHGVKGTHRQPSSALPMFPRRPLFGARYAGSVAAAPPAFGLNTFLAKAFAFAFAFAPHFPTAAGTAASAELGSTRCFESCGEPPGYNACSV